MSIVYLLHADQVPAPPVWSGLIDPNVEYPATPATFEAFGTGQTSGVARGLNRNSKRAEAISRYPGGWGVCEGLELYTDGTTRTLYVGPGTYQCDGPITIPGIKSIAVPDEIYDAGDLTVRKHVWLSRTGDLSLRDDLTAPAAAAIYLGSVRTHSGLIYDLDYSGRYTLLGFPRRRTADPGMPTDTPPANLPHVCQTSGGSYWWNGTAYETFADSLTVLTSHSHASSGTLEEMTVAGSGIGLAVVNVAGVWKLQITNTDPGSAVVVTDTKAAADGSDAHPGSVLQKLHTSEDVVPSIVDDTLGTATSRQVQLNLHGHAETLPSFDVTVPKGEDRLVLIDFHHRGTFYDNRVSVEPGIVLRALDGTEIDNEGFFEVTVLSESANALNTVQNATGGFVLLRVVNRTPDFYNAASTKLHFTPVLRGFGWTAGDTPTGTPTVTVLGPQQQRSFTCKAYVSLPAGHYQDGVIDLSPVALVSTIRNIQVDCLEQPDVRIMLLASGQRWSRDSPYDSQFQVQIVNPAGQATNSYGTYDQLELTITVDADRVLPVDLTANATWGGIGAPTALPGGGTGSTPTQYTFIGAWLGSGTNTTAFGLTNQLRGAALAWIAPGDGVVNLLETWGITGTHPEGFIPLIYVNNVLAWTGANAFGAGDSGTDFPAIAVVQGDLIEVRAKSSDGNNCQGFCQLYGQF